MRIFVGLNYNRDHKTEVCGAADCREAARRLVEQVRNEILHWAREATDGPDGGAGLDNAKGDMVGHVLAFDVAGTAKLHWRIDQEMGFLAADSSFHDEGSPLCYTIFGEGDDWTADFDGKDFAHGTLEDCMAACRKSEDASILEAIQDTKSGPETVDGEDLSERMLRLLNRMLNPEELGFAIPAHVRDEVREVLGMQRCESPSEGTDDDIPTT